MYEASRAKRACAVEPRQFRHGAKFQQPTRNDKSQANLGRTTLAYLDQASETLVLDPSVTVKLDGMRSYDSDGLFMFEYTED